MIVARREYTVASGKDDEALAWLGEVRGWESYRLIYPRGCRVSAMAVGRINKVVVEAEYATLQEYLTCLRCATKQPEFADWRRRQDELCLNVHGSYVRRNGAESVDLSPLMGHA